MGRWRLYEVVIDFYFKVLCINALGAIEVNLWLAYLG